MKRKNFIYRLMKFELTSPYQEDILRRGNAGKLKIRCATYEEMIKDHREDLSDTWYYRNKYMKRGWNDFRTTIDKTKGYREHWE